ncbi:Protein spire [Gossypium australe]|uniref:Protein spire n=1 Tax=Gossypium australe TaxID=47621 RepID=A0A5B6X6A1_9ROSI|nr:Protein spire [Gossypium australe]
MSKRYVPPLPPPSQQASPLFKQRSWSPDAERDEAWLRRKEVYGSGLRRSQSFTEDDLDELKGCLDLGFGFEPDSPELDPKLSHALPALPFYCAVNRQYNGRISRSSSASSMDSFSDAGSTNSIIDRGDDPEMVKIKLRQWAQVVACSVRQFPRGPKFRV